MAGMSDYTEQTFLNWYFRRGTWTGFTPYTRLFTTSPNWDTGSTGTELTGGTGYTTGGQAAARGATNWEVVSSGNGYRAQNKLTSAFSWTASGDWSQINGAGIYDTNSGGNLIWGDALDTGRDLANGDTFRFAAAAMKFDIDVTTAAGLTNTAKQALLNHIFISDQTQIAATAYIALYTAAPNKYTGAGGTEVTVANGYSRLAITSSSFWDAAATSGTGYYIDNAADANFTTATGSWSGPVVAAALVDTSSGAIGAYYAIDDFTGVTIDNGDTFKISAGNFRISVDESN